MDVLWACRRTNEIEKIVRPDLACSRIELMLLTHLQAIFHVDPPTLYPSLDLRRLPFLHSDFRRLHSCVLSSNTNSDRAFSYNSSVALALDPNGTMEQDNASGTFIWGPRWQKSLDKIIKCIRQIRAARQHGRLSLCDSAEESPRTSNGVPWCNAIWAECLRIIGELDRDSALLVEAEELTERLRPSLDCNDSYRASAFYYSAARQYICNGKPTYRTLALAAAYAVRSTAIPGIELMPAEPPLSAHLRKTRGSTAVAIRTVHISLLLDWWAYKETSDPVFLRGAKSHLDAAADFLIFDDGSTLQAGSCVTSAGQMNRSTVLGAHEDCCWSEAQAWAIAGYLRAYEETNDEKYLVIGRTLLSYWEEHCDDSLMPPYNFEHPDWKGGRFLQKDFLATAIVCEQLARLAVKNPVHPLAQECIAILTPMLEGLLAVLNPFVDDNSIGEPGRLATGYVEYPDDHHTASEVTWVTTCLLFALYYLKTGWLVG